MTTADRNGPPGAASFGAGAVLRLIRDGDAVTRADLARRTGMARSTVAQRVEVLLGHRLVREAGGGASTGGRPAVVLEFNRAAGVILTADLGASHSRLGITDLGGALLADVAVDMAIADGPEPVLGLVHEHFGGLLDRVGRDRDDVRGIGVGVPGPVAFSTGQAVNPPIMPGWDGFSVPNWFARRYDAPVLVDNDVNIMALGEHWMHWRETEHLLFIKVGTGIGCGIVSNGAVHRGAQGAAGDIGHIHVPAAIAEERLCRCGNVGCLEAVAGGSALAQRLTEAGVPASGSRDVVGLVRAGDSLAGRLVREAGRALGEVLAACVNFYNPGIIVIGGDLAEAHAQLLAGVREITIQRSLPLATRDLRTVPSRLGDQAGVVGAAIMVLEHVLSPAAIDRELQEAVPV